VPRDPRATDHEEEHAMIIGTIGDAERRYPNSDPAYIWWAITTGAILTNPDGERVRLEADPDKRLPNHLGEPTLWQVEELPA
jgi:hypothetical protein